MTIISHGICFFLGLAVGEYYRRNTRPKKHKKHKEPQSLFDEHVHEPLISEAQYEEYRTTGHTAGRRVKS